MCLASERFVWVISGVGRSNGLICSHAQEKKGKNRRLMANFAHAQPRPLWTNCNQILHVGSGGQRDNYRPVLWKLVKGFRSYRTPQTPFPILNIHRPYNSVNTTVLHCDIGISLCSILYTFSNCTHYFWPDA